MPDYAVGRAILTAIRLFLAVAFFGGIVAVFRFQLGQRRKALSVFRGMRLTGEGQVFFVRHASEQNLADRSQAITGDGFGVLTVTPRAVVYRTESAAGRPGTVEFLPGQTHAEWVGRRLMNGAWSWFALTAGGETHYFTSAERASVIGSRRLTRKIHDAALAQLGRSSESTQEPG